MYVRYHKIVLQFKKMETVYDIEFSLSKFCSQMEKRKGWQFRFWERKSNKLRVSA